MTDMKPPKSGTGRLNGKKTRDSSKQNKKFVSLLIALSFFSVIFSGCGSLTPPLYYNPDYKTSQFTEIAVVLPIIDLRVDKYESIDLTSKKAIKRVTSHLKWLNYQFSIIQAAEVDLPSSFKNFSDETLAWLSNPIYKNKPFIMVISVIDITAEVILKRPHRTETYAEFEAYLFDRVNKTLIWHGTGSSSTSQKGMLAMATISLDKNLSISNAQWELLNSFPKKGKAFKSQREDP